MHTCLRSSEVTLLPEFANRASQAVAKLGLVLELKSQEKKRDWKVRVGLFKFFKNYFVKRYISFSFFSNSI